VLPRRVVPRVYVEFDWVTKQCDVGAADVTNLAVTENLVKLSIVMKITNKKANPKQLQLMSYAKRTLGRYQAMSRTEKSQFLNQVQLDFGGHRKAIIRLYMKLSHAKLGVTHPAVKGEVTGNIFPFQKTRGRKRIYYESNVVWWLQTLWIAMNQISEKLMHPMIPNWLAKCTDPELSAETKRQLIAMSPSTIERLIRSYKKENYKRNFCTTKPPRGKELMIRIPTRVQNFQASSCGFIEGDTVAHCGNTLMGLFAWTFNVVDHKSLWTEQASFLSNTAENIVTSTIKLRARLPFKIVSFHSDGGSEFINNLLYEYLQNPKDFVTQTHGRAYRKNDQARVEQRNWTHVRQIFGYERIGTQTLVDLMNDIYQNEWRLLNNFFTAARKQTLKVRIGSKFKRTFDKPRTPFQRVLEDSTVSEIEKDKLKEIYATLNPFELKKSLDKKLKIFQQQLKEQNKSTDQQNKEAA
jgi:hypothetical protein